MGLLGALKIEDPPHKCQQVPTRKHTGSLGTVPESDGVVAPCVRILPLMGEVDRPQEAVSACGSLATVLVKWTGLQLPRPPTEPSSGQVPSRQDNSPSFCIP